MGGPSVSILWGDPSVINSRAHQWYFFLSNLAIRSDDPQLLQNGCVSNLYPALSGACIARSVDNGETFQPYQCMTNNNDFYDGSSMDSGQNGEIYAAYRDVNLDQIHVWKAADENSPFKAPGDPNGGIPMPFAGRTMVSHPRIRVDYQTNFLYAMSVEQRVINTQPHYFAIISRYFRDAAGYWSWTTPRDMPLEIVDFPKIQMSDRAIRTGPQFAFDIGAPSGCQQDDVRILYTVRATDMKLAVRGAYCTRDLFTCSDAPEWSSETNGTGGHRGNQFNPNLKAFPGFLPWLQPVWKTTYMSTEDNPNWNIVSIWHANFEYYSCFRQYFKQQAVPDQTPCTGTDMVYGGYWSDYDDLQIGYITSQDGVRWLKTFPDSTSTACYDITQSTAKPQHTSSVKFQ
jgi:hypothetical protein